MGISAQQLLQILRSARRQAGVFAPARSTRPGIAAVA